MARWNGGIGPKRQVSFGTASSFSGIWDMRTVQQEVGASNWARLPDAPTSLSTSGATDSAVTVSFTAPSNSGTISNYEYALSTNGGASFGSFTALSPADASSPVTITGLSSSTSYQIKLKAVNQFGAGAESTAASFTTAAPSITGVEYLVIAGGGGAGGANGGVGGGGAGAGGYRTTSGITISRATTYTVTVGGGGVGGNSSGPASTNGSDSTFNGLTSTGGGRGGHGGATGGSASGGNGGSGGAGVYIGGGNTGSSGISSPATSPVQGYAAGAPTTSDYSSGGGGAGQAGTQGGSNGKGGDGVASSITGTSVTRGGGGGGGGRLERGGAGSPGAGGGGAGSATGNGGSGTANTGGGGGGGAADGYTGGSGGSGIVVIRWSNSFAAASSTTGSPTYANTGGYHIYTFTSSGSITP